MAYLTAEIIIYLLVALLIGLAIGWVIWGFGRTAMLERARAEGRRDAEEAEAMGAHEAEAIASLHADLENTRLSEAELRRRLAACDDARHALETRKTTLEAELAAARDTIERLRGSADLAPEPEPEPEPEPRPAAAFAPDAAADPGSGAAPGTAGEAPPPPPTLLPDRPAEVDDLKRIKGIGPKMEAILNAKGVYLFRQLANFTPSDVAWVTSALDAFPGRIERDRWVEQAQTLHLEKYGTRHDEG